MKIFNIEEHLSCHCYDKREKPLIEVRKVMQTEAENISPSFNEIVFMLKGKMRVTMDDSLTTEVSKGNMILLPAGKNLRFKALTGCLILFMRLEDDIQLCHTYNLERLNSKIKEVDIPAGLTTLEINSRLKHFLTGLLDTWEDGLKCRYYFLAKITELLIMLRAYYSEEQLFYFFYYSLASDMAFSEFVRNNHMRYQTVNKLADAMNISPQQFSRRFNTIFGEAPYRWMLREKGLLIYGEICRSNKPLKVIAEEFGFTVQANFNRFCKTEFGMSPGEIRQKRKLDTNN